MDDTFKAKKLAQALGISPYELKKWEKNLELKIPRDQKGHRIYDQAWKNYFQAVAELAKKEIAWSEIKGALRAPDMPQSEQKQQYAEIEFVY